MKKSHFYTGIIALCILFGIQLSACCTKESKAIPEKTQRIKEVERTMVFGTHCFIIEVDGVEYLCQYKGGITPLVNQSTE